MRYDGTMRTALLSAYEKTEELADFARALKERGWSILASTGTMNFLVEKGIEAKDVATIVGKPILGHRVVSLSREIHAGILARDEDAEELKRLGIPRIDLVYADLYPLQAEIAKPEATEKSVIEKTDIGGPTLLRAAGKARRIVISHSSQCAAALDFIDREAHMSDEAKRKYLAGLAGEAESVVADYAAISARFNRAIAGR